MKSKLAASIHLFTAGKCWMNAHNTVSSRSIFAALDRRHVQIDYSSKTRGFESSSHRAVHSAALEDDAFSELGPGESECSTLVFEKIDDFVKGDDESSELDAGLLKCNAKKSKFVAEKHDSFLDDDVFSDLDPGISECSEKIKLVTEKPDDFLDDAFSELGPGISECAAKKIKLVTEKRDRVQKTQSDRRQSSSKALSSDYKPNAMQLFEAISRASTSSTKSSAYVHSPNVKKLYGAMAQPCTNSTINLHSPSSADHKELPSRHPTEASTASSTDLPSLDCSPTSTDISKNVSEAEYPLSVSIKNIPSKVGLPEIIEAMSVFGKVSGASFVTKSDKSKCCNIDFEDADSSRRAVLAGKVEVGSNVFLVDSHGAVDLVAVRVTHINGKTADSAIHSVCKSVGELVGLTRTSKDSVDAFFYVRNDKSHSVIVRKLNKTVLDLNRWTARALENLPTSSEAPSHKDVEYNLKHQILHHFNELKMELLLKELSLQDLEHLTASIMHLRDVPSAPYQSGNR